MGGEIRCVSSSSRERKEGVIRQSREWMKRDPSPFVGGENKTPSPLVGEGKGEGIEGLMI